MDQNGPDVRLQQLGFPGIGQTEQQLQFAVPRRNHRVLTEDDGLGPGLGPGHLGEDDPGHAGRDHHADDRLHAHEDDRLGTLLGGLSGAVADGVLRLHAEQEARGEVLDGPNAGDVRAVELGLAVGKVLREEIFVHDADEVVNDAEEQPG